MTKKIIAILLLSMFVMLMPTKAQAKNVGGIEGTVNDEQTGKPLPMANIIVTDTKAGAAVDVNGKYFISPLPPSKYKVVATMIGYTPVTKEVVITEGEITRVDFELAVNPIEVGGVVVTGTRTPRFIKDVPVRTEVITSRELQQKEAPNLYEALEGIPVFCQSAPK